MREWPPCETTWPVRPPMTVSTAPVRNGSVYIHPLSRLENPADSDSVYLTLSGYRTGDNAPYVLHSSDAGDNWTDISANLPDIPANWTLRNASDAPVTLLIMIVSPANPFAAVPMQ